MSANGGTLDSQIQAALMGNYGSTQQGATQASVPQTQQTAQSYPGAQQSATGYASPTAYA